MADELVIIGSEATIKVISEYNIRTVLCDGESEVIRQDGSTTVPGTLLPRVFYHRNWKNGENVIGYKLIAADMVMESVCRKMDKSNGKLRI